MGRRPLARSRAKPQRVPNPWGLCPWRDFALECSWRVHTQPMGTRMWIGGHRILDRKPKGVWVVRFKSGAYLIDEKYLELLEDEASDE